MDIKIGACSPIQNAEILADTGFDYIELGISPIAKLTKPEYLELWKKVKDAPIKPEVFNLFVPGDIRLVGDERSPEAISDYLDKALPLAADLGGKIIVFGSGGARKVPVGYDRERAFGELAEFCQLAGEKAEDHGITIAIEPLRKAESNIINGTAEGLRLVAASDHPRITVLIDFFHMAQDDEPASCVLDAGSDLTHVHIANGESRAWPADPDESPYGEFFQNLKTIEYSGRISVEGRSEDHAGDAPAAERTLRSLIQQ